MIALQERPCPICDTSDRSRVFRESTYDERRWSAASFSSRKAPEYMHFRLLTCERCGLTYGSPVASPESAADAYRTASYDAAAESRDAARTYAHYLRNAGFEPGAALDIGAADGAFLRELRGLGFRAIVGIEPSEAPIAHAPDDVRSLIRNEMFDGSRFDENSFDLVTCFQTMEHVYEPRALLEEIRRILKPGGKVFLVAHDLDALSARVLGERSPIYDIEHVQLFNASSMRYLLKLIGFSSVQVFSILNAYRIEYWLRLFPFPAALKRTLQAVLRAPLMRPLQGFRIPVPAGNIAVFATKPERP
jgi:SAM-dependent methyltransferase